MRRALGLAALVALAAPWPTSAKCARREQFYCVTGTFSKAAPSLALAHLPDRCFGELKVGKKTVTVVFADALPCPAVGAKVTGDLSYLCQDTGEWTTAEYAFTRGQETFCARKPAAAEALAKELAAKIPVGMKRPEVRKALTELKFLEGSFTETYYLHPDTVLSVPFDEPDGGYGLDNPVSGPVEVSHRVLPKL